MAKIRTRSQVGAIIHDSVRNRRRLGADIPSHNRRRVDYELKRLLCNQEGRTETFGHHDFYHSMELEENQDT